MLALLLETEMCFCNGSSEKLEASRLVRERLASFHIEPWRSWRSTLSRVHASF